MWKYNHARVQNEYSVKPWLHFGNRYGEHDTRACERVCMKQLVARGAKLIKFWNYNVIIEHAVYVWFNSSANYKLNR